MRKHDSCSRSEFRHDCEAREEKEDTRADENERNERN